MTKIKSLRGNTLGIIRGFYSELAISLPVLSSLYADRLESAWIRRRFAEIESLSWPSNKLKPYSWLVNSVKNARCSNSREICHVVGSGSTVFDSISSVGANDFVIGFNFASLLPLSFNIFFIEGCTYRSSSLSLASRLLAECYKMRGSSLLIAKNLLINQYDLKLLRELYEEIPYAVPDIVLCWRLGPASRITNRAFLTRRLLRYDPLIMKQARSSIFTSIALAIHAGFKKIVVHGLDMGGPHFYSSNCVEWPKSVDREDIESYVLSSRGHHDESPRYLDLLYGFKSLSIELGIDLVSGCRQSRSSKVLGASL